MLESVLGGMVNESSDEEDWFLLDVDVDADAVDFGDCLDVGTAVSFVDVPCVLSPRLILLLLLPLAPPLWFTVPLLKRRLLRRIRF